MIHLLRSLTSGLSAAIASVLAVSFGGWTFDDLAFQRFVFATLLSTAGGLGVALLPRGEQTWSWVGFFRFVALGILVGPPTMVLLSDTHLAVLEPLKPWIEVIVGASAYPIFSAIQRSGPWRSLMWLLRLRSAALQQPSDTSEGK